MFNREEPKFKLGFHQKYHREADGKTYTALCRSDQIDWAKVSEIYDDPTVKSMKEIIENSKIPDAPINKTDKAITSIKCVTLFFIMSAVFMGSFFFFGDVMVKTHSITLSAITFIILAPINLILIKIAEDYDNNFNVIIAEKSDKVFAPVKQMIDTATIDYMTEDDIELWQRTPTKLRPKLEHDLIQLSKLRTATLTHWNKLTRKDRVALNKEMWAMSNRMREEDAQRQRKNALEKAPILSEVLTDNNENEPRRVVKKANRRNSFDIYPHKPEATKNMPHQA